MMREACVEMSGTFLEREQKIGKIGKPDKGAEKSGPDVSKSGIELSTV